MNLQPIISDVGDLFWWKTTQTLTSNSVGNSGQRKSDNIKTRPDAFFVFCAWRGVSNYDSVTQLRASIGASPGTAATALYPACVPNNFEVTVKRNNRFDMMDQPMPQACIASTGYRAGNQLPFPIIYPPSTTFNFTIYNTAPVMMTLANNSTQIDLRVDFGLFGYNVLAGNLATFLKSWPALYGKAMAQLTGQSLPPLTPDMG